MQKRRGRGHTIQQSTTSKIHIHHPILNINRLDITRKAIINKHANNLTNLALGDELADLDAKREVAGPNSLHEEEVLRLGSVNQDAGLGRIDREGLFAENMLSSVQGEHDILEVVGVRRCDVDDLDVGVCDEVLVGTVGGAGLGNLDVLDELGGAVFRGRGRDRGDGVRDVAGIAGGRVDEEVLDEG